MTRGASRIRSSIGGYRIVADVLVIRRFISSMESNVARSDSRSEGRFGLPKLTLSIDESLTKQKSPYSDVNSDKNSVVSMQCRICHEDGSSEELIDPCECSGTLGLIHSTCLEKWLSTSNTDRCEICKYNYVIQKKNKPFTQSFKQWWSNKSVYGPQGISGDIMCFMVLTPLCAAATYLCSIGATAYIRLGLWEGAGLAVLCVLLVLTYFLWLIVMIRFYLKSWHQWCKQNQDVKLLLKHKTPTQYTDCIVYLKNHKAVNDQHCSAAHLPDRSNFVYSWMISSLAHNRDSGYDVQQGTFV